MLQKYAFFALIFSVSSLFAVQELEMPKSDVPKVEIPKGETPAAEKISGKIYVTSWFGNIVSILDARNLHVSAVANVGIQDVSVALTPDEKIAWVANNGSSTISVIDTTSDRVTKVFYIGNAPRDICFSADGKEAYVTCELDDALYVIDPTTYSQLTTIDTGTMPQYVTATNDKLFVSNLSDGTVSVINRQNKQTIATISCGLAPMGLCTTKDGKWLLVACHNSNHVAMIDIENLQVTTRIQTQPGPTQVAVHPSQTHAIVTCDGIGSVQKIDLKTNQIVKTIPIASDAGTHGAVYTAKGLLLISNTGSNSITALDSDSGEILCSVSTPFAPKGLAFKNPQ